ncbi:MAG TPA: tRNA (adenosine(37)-N6)-threonylcarbamoyltransferase complex dimerization subunit type 1 TsaB [Ktedonobacteraceae bacterium]|jgi:tRNA threonylcarbamoyladenosine biosynthesis protein TsaB
MLLLALDTSTRQSSVSLSTEDELLGEYVWRAGGNHSVELLDHIQRLCADAQCALSQLDAIVVATGPGSFNGVRVALATAKSLSFALKKTLIGISTLDCIAAQQQQWLGPVCALLEAGRGELYAACYAFESAYTADRLVSYRLQRLSDYLLFPPPLIASYLQEHASNWLPANSKQPLWLFTGETSEASRLALAALFPEQCLFTAPARSVRQASVLATLGLQRLRAGEQDDPLLLEPFYLRRPSITKSTRKQPLFASASRPLSGEHDTERGEGALRH